MVKVLIDFQFHFFIVDRKLNVCEISSYVALTYIYIVFVQSYIVFDLNNKVFKIRLAGFKTLNSRNTSKEVGVRGNAY